MEIYNEEVRDLLGKEITKSLEVKERADIGVFVKDLSGYVVHNADDVENIMKLGNKNRAVGATKMNSESSRSHAIFSITIESSETDENGEQHVKMGKLQLVDLVSFSVSFKDNRNLFLNIFLYLGWFRTTEQNAGHRNPIEGSDKNKFFPFGPGKCHKRLG